MSGDIVKFKRIAIPGGITQTHLGARALETIKHIKIFFEKLTKPRAVRGNAILCFHCPFMLSMNTDSSTIKHKILEEVDLSLNRIKLIYTSEDTHHLLFSHHML